MQCLISPLPQLLVFWQKQTGVDPFDAPPAQIEALKEGDFGIYKDAVYNNLPVNFLSTVDTTGGTQVHLH